MSSPSTPIDAHPSRLPVHLLLAAIVASSEDAIVSKLLDGTITSWNRAAERIFGYTAEEMVGSSIYRLIPPELHAEEGDILARLRRGERIEHFESRRRRKDGSIIFVSLTISPIRDAAGVVIGASKFARDVTQRHRTQNAQAWLAAIVDSSDDAIVSKDLSGMITSWNKAAERIFGYEAREIVGRSVLTLIPPELHSDETMILDRLRNRERIEHFETERLRKDGTRISVSLTISPIIDAKGDVIGASKIARDITRQKKSELERLALLESERAARREAESMVEVAWVLSSELVVSTMVQKATDIATQLTGAKFGAFFYNVVNERQESYTLYALSGAPREAFARFALPRNTAVFGPTFRGEGVVRLADVTADPRYGRNAPHHGMPAGHLPVRSYLAVPVKSARGEVIGGMFFGHPDAGVFSERAERLAIGIAAQAATAMENAKLYETLQNTVRRLDFSLAALDIGDWIWNAATDEMYLSERTAQMYGLPAGFAGKRTALRTHLHPEDQEPAREAAQRAMAAGTDYEIEYRVLHPELGERWILVKGQPMRDAEGKVVGMMGVAQDMTERKRAEVELRESRAKLQSHAELLEQAVAERTAKLRETIGELEAFSYSVSHDMRTPLRAMHGYADRLLRVYRDQLDAEARHHLERIEKNAERLELLVRDVLAYSRVAKEDIALAPIDLEQFLENLRPSLPDLQRPGVTFLVERPLPRVRGHEAYLSQVFSNLIGNALKFSAPERPPVVIVRATAEEGTATVEVVDNGIGIAPEHFERIFQIFGRVYPDKKYDGTGIGLSIVRKAVQRMGGQVTVRSVPGEGSCFAFTLPLA